MDQMESKIRQYVDYQFRFDSRPDLEELKEEIVANLIDRYHEKLNEGKTSEEAYVEAIKSMGDFSNNSYNYVPFEYSFKPSFSDIFLVCSAITSIFGLLLTLMSNVVGVVTILVSMLFFGSASYYLYSYSQYVRKEELDIAKHNLLLRKIFKYVKTNFIFWAIGLSIVLTKLIAGTIATLALIDMPLDFDIIKDFIILYIIVFVIVFISLSLVFWYIYQRLMSRYTELTGEQTIKSQISDSFQFIFSGSDEKRSHVSKVFLFSKITPFIVPVLTILTHLPLVFATVYVSYEIKAGPYSFTTITEDMSYLSFLFKTIKSGFPTEDRVIAAVLLLLSLFTVVGALFFMIYRKRTVKKSLIAFIPYSLFSILTLNWYIYKPVDDLTVDKYHVEDSTATLLGIWLIGLLIYLLFSVIRYFIKRKQEPQTE